MFNAPGGRNERRWSTGPAGAIYAIALVATAALVTQAHSTERVAVLYVTETRTDRVTAYAIAKDGRLSKHPFQRVSVGDNPRRLLATEHALYVATKDRVEALQIDPDTGCLSWFRSPASTEPGCPRRLKNPSRNDETVIRPDRMNKPNFQYLAVDPDQRYLYAAAARLDRIIGYPIAPGGPISEIGSCIQGRWRARYRGLAATSTKLYAASGGDGRIDVFPLSASGAVQSYPTSAACKGGLDGGRPCTSDNQCRVSKCRLKRNRDGGTCKNGENAGSECETHDDCGDEVKECRERPELPACADGPDAGNQCAVDSDCTDDADCRDGICRCVTVREPEVSANRCARERRLPTGYPETSSDFLGRPRALLLSEDERTLYMTEVLSDRIVGCPIDPADGSLPDCPQRRFDHRISRTNIGAEYEQIALSGDLNPALPGNQAVLFASIFLNGKLRAFKLDSEGLLPRRPKKRHPSNVFSSPVGLKTLRTCDDQNNPTYNLFVAQGDLDRVDHFFIDEDGFTGTRPDSHTSPAEGSFPNDVAVVSLGSANCEP